MRREEDGGREEEAEKNLEVIAWMGRRQQLEVSK